MYRVPQRRRSIAVGAVLMAAGLAALSVPGTASASSHREAPLIAGAPQYDNTDVYAFNSGSGVTLVGSWNPFEFPAGGPNFYPFPTDAAFDFNIDQNADAKADIVYRYTFRDVRIPGAGGSFTGNGTFLYNNGPVSSLTDENLLFRQAYSLTKTIYNRNGSVRSSQALFKDRPVVPSYVGKASMGSPADYKKNLFDKGVSYRKSGNSITHRSFVGQSDDPFFLDLRVFDLAYGGDLSEVGVDSLAGYNVNTVALEVPKSDFSKNGKGIIGVWSTTSVEGANGRYTQVSRLGSPLVNEVVAPYAAKDLFNASKPQNDAQFAPVVLNPELPKVLEAIYKIPAPKAPRNDLVQVFLTGVPGLNQPKNVVASEMLRLNLAPFADQKPSTLGVLGGDLNGFPNGRRLSDDITDSALQVVEGILLPDPPAVVKTLGDGVNKNDVDFSATFPYVAIPHSGSDVKMGAAASNSTSSLHPTLLNGGNTDALMSQGGGLPYLETGLLGLGALLVLGGVAASRRAASSGALPATA